jgi:hypothetical protein
VKSDSCGKCFYCKTPIYPRGSASALADPNCISTRDHYTPISITSGADLQEDRIVLACERCNNLKANTPPEIFEFFVAQAEMTRGKSALIKEYRRFCYLLMVAGFRSAKALAVDAHPIELPDFLSFWRGKDTPAAPVATIRSPAPRGRFSLKDLRRSRRNIGAPA